MKRLILAVPEGLTFDQLSVEQQTAIDGVFGQFVNPIPGTQAANGKQVVDAVTADNFDSQAITDLGLPFEILAYQQWDGSVLNQIVPLNVDNWTQYLPEVEGETKVFHIPHQWAGWPS